MTKQLEWLKEFSETCGVSGDESRIKALMLRRLNGKAQVSYDKLGSVVFTNATKVKDAPKICLLPTWMKWALW